MNSIDNTFISQVQTLTVTSNNKNNTNGSSDAGSFSNLLVNALNNVNELHKKAGKVTTAFELGNKDISLAEVMVARSKAGIATEATIQIRNKLVDSYKEVMNMSV